MSTVSKVSSFFSSWAGKYAIYRAFVEVTDKIENSESENGGS
jgi:hypothetical protein